VVRQASDTAFADAQRLRQRLLQAGAVAALAILLLAGALAGAVVRPLRRLAEVAQRRRHGEVVVFAPTPDRPGDEVQQLAAVLHALDADVRQRMQQQAQAQQALQLNLQALHDARTDLQRLNAELEQRVQARTEQLQAANAELDSFAYAVSHDLRAPLRAMSGFSQALLEDHAAQLNDEARLYLQQIIVASHRMGGLIDGLLALSRSTRGTLRDEAVDLGRLAQRVQDELQLAEPQRQVQLSLQGDLQVRGDPRMLESVMRNLIGNAWKYTAHQPQARVQVRETVQDGQRWFSVEDNGVGFDMAHAGRLFQAFSRLHRADEFPGLGIGLATVQRIVRRHGGQIQAEGRLNQGACIRFTLGAARPRQDDTP
jgi:signal transduction histidine kinase